jgi:ATP-dependent protease ClpP protease subunit
MVKEDQTLSKYSKLIEERTNLTKEDIADIREKKKDFYIHSDKAIEYGIVDEVL